MSQFSGYKCDGCGTIRGESNRWFVLFELPADGDITPTVLLEHFGVEVATKPDAIHLCGETCVLKRVSAWLAGQPQSVEREETL